MNETHEQALQRISDQRAENLIAAHEEISKLREQLVASNSLLECERRTHAACAERAEAAESKLKALDVQELQRTIEKLREGVTTIPEYMQMVQEQRQRIAELERKLAEQQERTYAAKRKGEKDGEQRN